jgi:hypothetical protein
MEIEKTSKTRLNPTPSAKAVFNNVDNGIVGFPIFDRVQRRMKFRINNIWPPRRAGLTDWAP